MSPAAPGRRDAQRLDEPALQGELHRAVALGRGDCTRPCHGAGQAVRRVEIVNRQLRSGVQDEVSVAAEIATSFASGSRPEAATTMSVCAE